MKPDPMPDRFQAFAVALAVASVLVLAFVASPWWGEPPAAAGSGRATRPGGTRPVTAPSPLVDEAVSDAVEDALQGDPALGGADLEVSVEEGRATLQGRVPSLAARDRASRVAGSIRGVLEVVDRLQVPPAPSLVESVTAALRDEPALPALQVRAGREGRVVLEGTVAGARQALLARDVAAAVRGVAEVESRLQVTADRPRTDPEIRVAVTRRLRWDALVDHGSISVSVARGEVRLRGAVGSAVERDRAIRLAWGPGVTGVEAADLAVHLGAGDPRSKHAVRADEDLRSAVQEALEAEPRLPGLPLTVERQAGQVVLRGRVRTPAQHRVAAEVARSVVGVRRVVNRVRVEPGSAPGDPAARVLAALARDGWLAGHPISVRMEDGAAVLSGSVRDAFLRARAEELAGGVLGVRRVRNLLVPFDLRPLADDPWLGGPSPLDLDWPPGPALAPTAGDAEILRDLADRLHWSALVDETALQVAVEDGVARLEGTVDTGPDGRAAAAAALAVGAVRVDDELTLPD